MPVNKLSLAIRAQIFASGATKNTFRPNVGREPTMCHLRDVATLVTIAGGTEEEIASAWLHDTAEDDGVTIEEIRVMFGTDVAEIVDGLTDPPGFEKMPTLERKTAQAERVQNKSRSVKLVKLADQISNAIAVITDPPLHWNTKGCLDYIEGARRIAVVCKEASPLLYELFLKAYKRAIGMHQKY